MDLAERMGLAIRMSKLLRGEKESSRISSGSNLEKEESSLPAFNPGLHPTHPVNIRAARARKLTYDPSKYVYVDSEGHPKIDEYGGYL